MKKIALAAVLAVCILLVMSCKSLGKVNDDSFNRIYNKYANDLILDGATQYTVRSGDRLVDIAAAQYNDPYYYPVIMLASRNVVADPDKIQPGMVLTVPNLQRNLNNQSSRAAIKGVINDCVSIESKRNRPDTAAGLRARANSL
ncbi:MAG: LysM peptidoglycan-binding domain-containing protein [Treponema sp.]|jgi:nucleoid-associated protein YgaU|nr:LysM peptidoglycan-binding domain-containing protein [Treponema sp.]